jgi:hypothetical protein
MGIDVPGIRAWREYTSDTVELRQSVGDALQHRVEEAVADDEAQ